MPTIVADLVSRISVTGVSESQAQLEGFGAKLDAMGASGDAAAAGIDKITGSAEAAATSLDAAAGSGDATAASLDRIGASGDAAAAGLERVAGAGDASATALDADATAGDAAAASLDRVAGSSDAAAAGLDRVGASGSGAAAGLGETATAADAAAVSAGGVGEGAGIANMGMLALAGGGLLAAKHAFSASTSFDTYFKDVVSINTSLQNNAGLQAQVRQGILDTSAATGMSANDVARSYYYIESAGLSGAKAQTVMNDAAKLGVIGMTDSTGAAQLLTSAMNAYGLKVGDVNTLNDQFTAGISHGVLRLADLQNTLPNLMASGSVLGIDIPQIMGTLDQLTNKGMTARNAGFLENSILTSFMKPNKDLQAILGSMGYGSGQDMIKALGFPEAMKQLYDQAGGDQTSLNKMFSNSRAARGLNSLFGTDNGAGLNDTISGVQNSSGEADKSFAVQEQATSFHLGVMKAKFNELMIALGDGIRPVVSAVADVFSTLFGVLGKIPGPILAVIGAVGSLVAGFAFLEAGGALLANMFAGPLGLALEALVAPILAAIGPIAAIAAALYLLKIAYDTNFLGFGSVVNAVGAVISFTFHLIVEAIMAVVHAVEWLNAPFVSAEKTVLALFAAFAVFGQAGAIFEFLGPLIAGAFGAISGALGPVVAGIEFLLPLLADLFLPFVALTAAIFLFKAAWDANFLGLVDIVTWVFSPITDAINSVMSTFETFKTGLTDTQRLLQSAGLAVTPLSQAFGTFDAVLLTVTTVIDRVIGTDITGWLAPILSAVQDGIGLFDNLTNHGWNPMAAAILAVGHALQALGFNDVGGFLDRIAVAMQRALNEFSNLRKFGVDPFSAAMESLSHFFTAVGLPSFARFFDTLDTAVSNGIKTFHAYIDAGLNPLIAALEGLSIFFGSVGLTGLAGFFNDLADSNWGQALRDLASGLDHVASGVKELGAWTLNVGIPIVTGWIVDAAQDAWSALKLAAGWSGDVIGDIGGWVLTIGEPTVVRWVTDLWSWLKGKLGMTDGGGDGTGMGAVQTMTVGGWVMDIAEPALTGWITSLAGGVWGWLKGKMGLSDGGGDGTGIGAVQTMSFGGWTMDVLAPIPGKIFDAATWVYDQIKTFSIGLFGIYVNIWSWELGHVISLATWLYGLVKDFSIGLFGVIVNVWGWAVHVTENLGTKLYGLLRSTVVDLVSVTVSVASWAVKTTESLGTKLYGLLRTTVVDLVSITVSVASWAVHATENLGTKLYGLLRATVVDLVSITINVASWAIKATENLGTKLYGLLRTTVVDLVSITVSVASWAVHATENLGTKLYGLLRTTVVDLVSITVSVASWAIKATESLGTKLYGLLRTTVVDLVSVMVNIANWTQGAWKDLGAWFVTRLQGFTADLTSVMVNIANWTQGAWKDLGTWLYGIVRDVKVFLVSVGVDISAWAQNLNWPDMGTWIKGELTKAGKIAVDVWDLINISTTVPDGTTANWTASGQTIGTAIATAVGHGIKAIFGFLTGGAPAHGGSGAGSSGDDISTAIDGFIKGFFTGAIQAAGTAIADYIEAIPAKMTSDFHKSVADNKSQIQTAFKLVTTIFDQIPDVDSTIKTAIDGFFGKVWTSVSTAFSSAWSSFTSKLNGLFSGGGSGLVANETGSNAFVGGGGNNGIWDGLIKALTPDLHISMPSLPGWLTDGTLLSPIKSLITTLGTTAKDLQTAWDALQKVINKVSGTGSGDASKTTWATGPVGGAGNRPSSLLSSPGGGFGAGGGFSDIPGVPPGGMFGGGGGGSSFSLPAPDTTAFLAAIATAKSAAMSLVATPFIAKFTADVSNAAFQFTQVMTWGGIWARTPFIGKFSGDVSNAARQFTQVMSWGTIWSTTAFIGKFLGDVANAAVQFTQVMTWGTIWGASSWTGKFLGDVSNAARQFTQVMTWGAIWGAFSSTGRFLGDVSNAAMQFTQVMTWGGIWGASSFTGKFDGDTSDAAKKYTDAFTWGDAWNAAVFTASFAIDTSGLIAASNTADAVAAHIAAIMPHSPAREGPLSQPITFDYIGDNFASMAGRLKQLASDSAGYIGSARGKGRLENATVISAINGAGRGMVTASPSGNRSGDTNLTLTVNFNGAQPDAQIVEKIKTAAVDAMAMALGHARAMQVGM